MELVEAKQPGAVGQLAGVIGYRLVHALDPGAGAAPPGFVGGAVGVHLSMNVEHEGVKMDPPLALDRRRLEEEVHQHRFAAPDPAREIEPLGLSRLHLAPPAKAEARHPAFVAGGGPVAGQGMGQRLQLLHRQFLVGIVAQGTIAAPGAVYR